MAASVNLWNHSAKAVLTLFAVFTCTHRAQSPQTQQLKAPNLIPTKKIPVEMTRGDAPNGPADGALQLLEIMWRAGEAHFNATGSGNPTVGHTGIQLIVNAHIWIVSETEQLQHDTIKPMNRSPCLISGLASLKSYSISFFMFWCISQI